MTVLAEQIKIPEKKKRHMAQMSRQTIEIPIGYMVTFSIERGHPCGVCRHMSMSVQRAGRVPNGTGLWMVAQELGFWGEIKDCVAIWEEDLQGHGKAINVVQTLKCDRGE